MLRMEEDRYPEYVVTDLHSDASGQQHPAGPDPSDGGRAAYRVEHRRGDAVAVLGETDDPLARHTLLGPLAVRLLDVGAEGSLLLVEQETGEVIARRALHPAEVARRTARGEGGRRTDGNKRT